MKKRLPLIFMCWTIIMVINFVYVRICAYGYNLLTMSASAGSSIAHRYYSSLVWMIIAACFFAGAVIWRTRARKKERKKHPKVSED